MVNSTVQNIYCTIFCTVNCTEYLKLFPEVKVASGGYYDNKPSTPSIVLLYTKIVYFVGSNLRLQNRLDM